MKKRIQIGASDFKDLIEGNSYFVDKSLLIKEFIENGAGGGGGARISPNAILVIKKDEVTMLPIKGKNNLDNLINIVPDIVSKINIKKDKEACCKEETKEEE